MAAKGACLWLDTSSISVAIVNTFKSACDKYSDTAGNVNKNKRIAANGLGNKLRGPSAVYKSSPISFAKAIKNEAELEGMRNSHLR